MVTTLEADYFLLAPVHSFAIADRANELSLLSFGITGVLVSVVSESLHRGWRRAERDSVDRQRSQQRLALLADAGTILTSPLSSLELLTQLVDWVVENRIADGCAGYDVELGDHCGTTKAWAHRDSAEQAPCAFELGGQRVTFLAIVTAVIETGEAVFLPECGPPNRATAGRDRNAPRHALEPHALISVPLIARGRTLGAIVMLNAQSPEAFSIDDFALAKDLAGRAALCLDNAQLIAQHQRDAEFQRFIAHASEVLSSSLDLQATLNGLLQLVVPQFADCGIVNLIDEHDEVPKVTAIVHTDPRKAQLARRLRGHSYLRSEGVEVAHATRTGMSQIIARVDEAYLESVVGVEFFPILSEIELGSSKVCVPLVARGCLLGALTCTQTQRTYVASDLPLFEDLARRAAVAILNARDFAHERRVADFLQSTSLPMKLPHFPGLRLHACYEAGKSDAQVGGDWYDAISLSDGRIVIAIGDVIGSGVEAAMTMSNLRQIMRGVVQTNPEPRDILETTDRALRAEQPERYATAFVSVFDPSTATLSYASAGHPPPFLRQADGTIIELSGGRGLPLGLRDQAAADPAAVVKLSTGSLLVLYTDGITEATHDPQEGRHRLLTALNDSAVRESSNVARAIQEAVLHDGSRDDVAVLVVGVEAVADARATADSLHEATLEWAFDAHDSDAAGTIRGRIVDRLRAHAASDEECHDAEVVFSELVGNVVRHAPGPIEVRLEMHERMPVLHVLDEGPGFLRMAKVPFDLMSVDGRGLSVVSCLTEEFNVTRKPHPLSGSHARAVLSINRHPQHLTWNPAYDSGHALIDRQHRALFDHANNLLAATISARPMDEVARIIDALVADVVQHFRDEELIFRTAGFPGATEHAAAHRELLDRAAQLVAGFHAGAPGIGGIAELFQFLAHDVVARHMLGADREFFPYLNAGTPITDAT